MNRQEHSRRRTGLTGNQAGWPGQFFEQIQAQPSEASAGEAGRKEIEASAVEEDAVEETVVEETVELAGVYIISVAARLLEMHPQTLRKYERFGLIHPSRTAGALRLYSDQDLVRLRIVRRLVEELGLNLAGVRLLMEIVSRLGLAIQAIERDEQAGSTEGARAAVAHMRAVLDFVNA